jgi:hypothetical protein
MMNIEFRYSLPIEGGTLPGEGNFLGWCSDETSEDFIAYDVELLDNDGTVHINLGASSRPCSINLSPEVLAKIKALTLQTSPKAGERMKQSLLTKAIRGCGKVLFFFFRLHDTPHVRVVDPSTGELLMES